jgi:hypothetical protein
MKLFCFAIIVRPPKLIWIPLAKNREGILNRHSAETATNILINMKDQEHIHNPQWLNIVMIFVPIK